MQSCWQPERRVQTCLTVLPTYRLCLSLSLPTPLICNTQFSPNLFFCYFLLVYSYFPTILRPLTPFNVTVRLTYMSPITPSPYVPFPEGNEGGLTSCAEAQLKPLDGLLVIQRLNNSEWLQRPTTRARGWMVRRGTLPTLP